jgi:hypothetical protein
MNGDGWIPIRFSDYPIIALSQLPIDPINQPPYYYSFVAGGSYELTAALEADSSKGPDAIGGKDGGDHNFVYEVGTNKKLTPSSVQARAEPDSLKQGLVGWWTFDEGTGTTTKDLSGNGNDGVLVNNPQWVDGKVGKALYFDGTTGSYVRVNTSTSLLFGTGPFTVLSWYTKQPAPQIGAIFNPWIGNGINLWLDWSGIYGQLHFTARRGDQACGYSVSYGLLQSESHWDGRFHFIAGIRYPDGKLVLYYDGRIVAQNSPGASCNVDIINYWFAIGNGVSGAGKMKGIIDELRVYNRALSDSEIKVLYQSVQ